MKKNDAETATRMAIGVAVDKNRPGIIALFKKHGVNINAAYSNQELIVGILQAMKSNDGFKKDLATLLAGTAMEHKSNFAEGNFCFTGGSNAFFNWDGPIIPAGATTWTAPAATTPAAKSGSALSGVFNSTNLSNLFNVGLNTLSTSLANKGTLKIAQTAKEIEQEKTKQAQLLAASGAMGAANPEKPGMSTGQLIGVTALVLVGVGLLTWGAIALFKKKKGAKAAS